MPESIYPIISRAEAKEQGLKFYFTGKPCKQGHIANRFISTCSCIECDGEYRKSDKCKESQREYKKSDRSKESQREYKKSDKYNEYRNSDKFKELKKEYDKEYGKSDNAKETSREYKKSDKHKKTKQKYHRNRMLTDPIYKSSCNIRSLIWISIKNGGFKKTTKTAQILGCSFEEFKIHIENQFTEGMTWNNHGKWHYDHIYPVSKALDEAHLIKLNHYTNFQPLWAVDNIRKSNKV